MKRIAKEKSNRAYDRKKNKEKKNDKLCVNWKVYDNSFNTWIGKKDIVV